MPTADFFRRFGLFVAENFFDGDLCGRLRTHMRAGASSPGTVGCPGGKYVVDRQIRRVNNTMINDASTALVKDRFMDIKPDLERHFGVALAGCQEPQFLHYVTGDFYQWHYDCNPLSDASPISKARRISAVIFLNGTSTEPSDDCYGGGSLTFYKLFEDPVGQSVGFPLEANEGLLVGFRSDLPHSVGPVTHGDRYTIATWYV
jgi:predicted 2-oxoglutarate/Fe(II)-dependent dioxygenase YbiX